MEVNAKLRQQRDDLMKRRIRRNRRYARWSRNWAQIVVTFLFIYVALPFVAPTLMKLGATGPANALYTVYSPLCHQFAFRSMFLYGEQGFYPRAAANDSSVGKSFDERAAESGEFIRIFEREERQRGNVGYTFGGQADLEEWNLPLTLAARSFKGDEQMGYKVALCARDIAIYGAMVIGGIGFLFVRRKLEPVPIVLYILLGLGPIGIDGFSQLLSYAPFEFWPVRETLPEFRVLTGALFGFMNVWLAFPHLERSMIESAQQLEAEANHLETQLVASAGDAGE